MRPENNTKKMCFYKFVATLLLSLTHRTAKILQTNRLYQIKNILHRKIFNTEHSPVVVLHLVIGPIPVIAPSTAPVPVKQKTSVAAKSFYVYSMRIKHSSTFSSD